MPYCSMAERTAETVVVPITMRPLVFTYLTCLGQRLGKAQGQLFQAGYLFVVVVCLWVKTGKRNFRNATLYIYS